VKSPAGDGKVCLDIVHVSHDMITGIICMVKVAKDMVSSPNDMVAISYVMVNAHMSCKIYVDM
jgi:hypothetical protein